MLNYSKIINTALDNYINLDDEVEEEYYQMLEIISEDKTYIARLISELEENIERVNEKNIFRIINLIESIMEENNYPKEELYDFVLRLLYKKCCVNVSVPNRIIRIMISIQADLNIIFLNIFERTNENDITSVIITLNALYSPIGNFNEIDDKLIVDLLEKVKKTVRNNKNELLKNTIKQQLVGKINNEKFKSHFEEINTLIS